MMEPMGVEEEGNDQSPEGGPESEEHGSREAVTTKVMYKPIQEEIEQHMLTHLPFRSWCPYCVMGRGVSRGHYRKSKEECSGKPVVIMDYGFMTEEDKAEEESMPMLVIHDRDTKMKFAHIVPNKGVHPYAVARVAKDLELLGHTEIILKSDGEPAMISLKQAVKNEIAGITVTEECEPEVGNKIEKVIPEESPVGDSQSNGEAERELSGVYRSK